ncbi:RecX family transcriptional regulator [Halonatronum saccharophilum]|uniref:RecX family transcriptional regulator n=1 Tax=Halonatronum saccharophilum TaxID=150060 RepID=UPI0004839570|nr:RecX family transcriptional regulator [Halonatronum saccharophilum]
MDYVGEITAIKAQKNNQGRCSIFLDGEFFIGVDAELIYKFNLEKGHKLSEDLLDHIIDQEDFIKAKEAAFKLLSYRQRSRREIEDRLAKKGFDFGVIEGVLKVLDRLNYIDDRKFARAWIRDRITKGFGPWRIKGDLRNKGVAKKIIEEELASEYDFGLEYDLALKYAKKKEGRYLGLDDIERRYKLSGVLKRKGFSFEVINNVLDDLLKN